jgi:hypothetical protein
MIRLVCLSVGFENDAATQHSSGCVAAWLIADIRQLIICMEIVWIISLNFFAVA